MFERFTSLFGGKNEHEERVKNIQEFAEQNPEGDLESQFDNSADSKDSNEGLHRDENDGESDVIDHADGHGQQ